MNAGVSLKHNFSMLLLKLFVVLACEWFLNTLFLISYFWVLLILVSSICFNCWVIIKIAGNVSLEFLIFFSWKFELKEIDFSWISLNKSGKVHTLCVGRFFIENSIQFSVICCIKLLNLYFLELFALIHFRFFVFASLNFSLLY